MNIDEKHEILSKAGLDKILSFLNMSYRQNGYYTPEELIDLSINKAFTIDNPFLKIKRGTIIQENCSIINNSVIDGMGVVIKKNSIINSANLSGSNMILGEGSIITGEILLDNISTGNNNVLSDLKGVNNGQIVIGHKNKLSGVTFYNPAKQNIFIGNSNCLHSGLNLNCSFDKGGIYIGNNNNLGKDGGGVITTAYQYNKKWWGYVLIGNNVQSTRGAEILGYSLLGWTISDDEEKVVQDLLINGPIEKVVNFFEKKFSEGIDDVKDGSPEPSINLYGVVKVKMACLSGHVLVRDDTRIQSSFIRGVSIPERSKIYFSIIDNREPEQLNIVCQDKAIENIRTAKGIDWQNLPTVTNTNGYRESDGNFFLNEGKANLINSYD
jgi:hypothetical protein